MLAHGLILLFHPRLPEPTGERPREPQRLLFLVPAHNEEALIGACARSLVALDYPPGRVRVVVIADNCSDQTAERALAAGAEALERHDPVQRGKPRAIAWALAHQDLGALDAVVIIDADTVVEPGFARAIDASGALRGSARQGYFATLNEADNWLTLLAGVFARARYEVLYVLRERAGLNCPLTGNGMVLGAGLLAERGWNAFSQTEDWELYASLTAEGIPIRYVRGAKLLSQEIQNLSQGVSQRRRWVVGRRQTLRLWFGPLLRSRRIGIAQKVDALLELALPGPVVAGTLAVLVAALALILVRGGPGWSIAGIALSSQLPLGSATAAVLVHHPRRFKVALALALLPVYAVWRIGVSLGTLAGTGAMGWQKTQRNASPS
jgi:1,2-diacylglycerol 3-beta-glucosyltransferase